MCLHPTIVNGRQYPCGRCRECKQYESYLAGFQFEIAGKFYDYISFLTLTIDTRKLSYVPVAIYQDLSVSKARRFVFCRQDETVVRRCDMSRPIDAEFPYISGGEIRTCPISICVAIPAYFEAPFDIDHDTFETRKGALPERDECSERYRYFGTYYFPVVVSRYLQNSLKAFRERVRRAGIESRVTPECDAKVPPFVYRGCGEYGPKTGRPHFHLVIAYSKEVLPFIYDFVHDWEKNFGYVCAKHRTRFDKKAFGSFAAYTAEYSKKCVDDQHFVQRCCCVPPLRCFVSIGLNKLVNSYIRRQLLGDLYGKKYDELTSDDLYSFCERYFVSARFVRSNNKPAIYPNVFKQNALKFIRYSKRYVPDVDGSCLHVGYRSHNLHTPLSLLASLLSKHGDYVGLYREFRLRFQKPQTFWTFFDFVLQTPEVQDVRTKYSELYYELKTRTRFSKTPF